MSATNFKTENNTFRKLMGNGLTYQIPRFQRDYSWTAQEWQDLWDDMMVCMDPTADTGHYMGYLVLQSSNDKSFEVIDGQQRLTTLSILIIAALKNFKKLIEQDSEVDHNQRRMEDYRRSYIGFQDPITFVSKSKLTLNRNNNTYFQQYIVPLVHLPKRGVSSTSKLLRQAFEWFDEQIAKFLSPFPLESRGTELAKLIESMSDRLFFTVITVTDELNAYKVFETLNARGVRLSSTDLLKNFLFSIIHQDADSEHNMFALEDQWESIVNRLGAETLPEFLRAHWNSRHSTVRQAELFPRIKKEIKDRRQAFELLRQMSEDLDVYLALMEPEKSGWQPDMKKSATELRMFQIRQPLPLLLAAHRILPIADMATLLRACVVISFRYNVIAGFHTNDQERVYGQVAEKISQGQFTKLPEILAALNAVYVSDEVFEASFSEKELRTVSRNKKIVRYLLIEIEKHISGITHDLESDSFGIEHVFPQNSDSHWPQFRDEDADQYVYRLGNMVLLEASINRDLGNQPYKIKAERYSTSDFFITQRIAREYSEWTAEKITSHQRWLAKQACAIWRINQLS